MPEDTPTIQGQAIIHGLPKLVLWDRYLPIDGFFQLLY